VEYDNDDVEVAGTYEERMVDYAERQTKALEALRNFAFIVLLLGAVGLVVWLIAYFGS